ncbi:cellulose binding domain-containing protein [Spirosoma sp. KUDC1026]|uniref:cellulose binding domain-containing protein n=1 Tax=Spirosoma sp. KUDC1026 TaxID=2745947 RepID=UPI00159BA2C8|nr:cellulose binding domain-containing protein [Spirosoma sp. KUDC1026]QKZ12527.1 hypothetical protein HU175_07745 [Spirosoma sp. KUDC1026]
MTHSLPSFSWFGRQAFSLLLLLLSTGLLAQAQSIRYVKPAGTGNGSSWANASGDLQAMINASSSGQQVWVAQGIYKPGPAGNTDRKVSFAMKDGVAIYGGFAGSEADLSQRPTINPVSGNPSSTTLSGDIGIAGNRNDNSYHVIFNPQGLTTSAVLDGFLVTSGNANGSNNEEKGGGMYNDGGVEYVCSPTVQNCSFQNNSAGSGGAICNKVCSPVLTNCSFQNNSAGGSGGAIYNLGEGNGTSNPVLTNCSFRSNSANYGGAINNSGFRSTSNPVLTNCSFQNNRAATSGGAIYNNGQVNGTSNSVLTNCSFQSNSAQFGGAMINDGGNGGTSKPVLTNCSFQNNSAGSGGAMINSGGNGGTSNPVLTNCVFFGNGNGNSIYNIDGASVSATYSLFETGVTGYADGGNNRTTGTSPFVSTTDARLNACAPAINAGNNAANTTTTDLAGNPRRYNQSQIDMGAYEYQGDPISIIQQPPSGSAVCAGATVTTSVSTTGTVSTYQWYNDGALLSGQASATLTLANVQPTQSGSYLAVVTDGCRSLTSTAFSLTVNTPPATPTLLTQTGQSYPGGQSSVTVDVNSGNVNLVVSGCSGTINWTGPNNTSGTSSPIVVSTERVGQFVYSATCTSAQGCTSPATSATVTVQGRLTVLHRDVDNYADNNAIQPLLVLQNQGSSALPLARLTLRYYLTVENGGTLGNLNVNYAQVGGQNVRLRYVPLSPVQPGASGYVEVSFTAGAGNLAAGANTGPIQAYFAKSDYGALFEPDDYSYNPVRDQLTATQRITAYYDGVLIAGIEPGSGAQVRSVRALTESRNGADATQINTVLEVRNEGTVALNYSELKARYYFTSDGSERLQVEVDEGNVSARLVRLPAPVSGADYYLEIRYNQGGQLAPGASTGVVRYRISKPDGGRFNQANDYSYQEQPQERSQNSRVVVLAGSQVVWGTPPAGAPARLAFGEAGSGLSVKVLGNPIQNDQVGFEVSGAEGQPLQLQLLTPQGRVVSQQLVPSAEATQRHELSVAGQAGGLFLLQVSTPNQSQTVKVLKAY